MVGTQYEGVQLTRILEKYQGSMKLGKFYKDGIPTYKINVNSNY